MNNFHLKQYGQERQSIAYLMKDPFLNDLHHTVGLEYASERPSPQPTKQENSHIKR